MTDPSARAREVAEGLYEALDMLRDHPREHRVELIVRAYQELEAECERLKADLNAAQGDHTIVRPAIPADLISALDDGEKFLREERLRAAVAEARIDRLRKVAEAAALTIEANSGNLVGTDGRVRLTITKIKSEHAIVDALAALQEGDR